MELGEVAVLLAVTSDRSFRVQEVVRDGSPPPDSDTIRRAAARSTKASAKLERRELPADYVRPEAVERLLAERRCRDAANDAT
jgi:hypothetical protein